MSLVRSCLLPGILVGFRALLGCRAVAEGVPACLQEVLQAGMLQAAFALFSLLNAVLKFIHIEE